MRVGIIFGDVFLFIPNIARFAFVRKKKETDKQTDRQTNNLWDYILYCPAKTEIILKKKEIESGGTPNLNRSDVITF